ncbi:DUF6233 domain-containing protein [Streptomyces sp. NPDC095613]|uniref:DUF6233 domain-containing protein n=1 Tax=Streptomyces sp. NPDC095613 TaxID=3155540 RepID=UPI00332B44AA
MFDLPPDLPRLRTLETWHATWLRRIREAIAAVEEREAEARRAAVERELRRPPVPEWIVSRGIDARREPVQVHQGGCHMAGKHIKPITRDEALHLLAAGVEACSHCRPDTELGVL